MSAPTASARVPDGRRRLGSIQSLRGVAALLVVIAHSVDSAQVASGGFLAGADSVGNFGAVGVDLFFVISGFVMAFSVAGGGDGPRAASSFLVQRWVRIAPPYLIVSVALLLLAALAQAALLPRKVLFMLLFVPWNPADHAPPVNSVLNLLLFVPWVDRTTFSEPPLPVGWTLSFEFTFYLLVAAMVVVGLRHRIEWLALVLVALVVGGSVLPFDAFLWRWLTNPILLEFAMGIVVFALWKRGATARGPWFWRSAGLLGVAALLLGVLTGYGQISEAGFVLDGSLSLERDVLWGLPCALIFAATVAERRPRPPIAGPALSTLGDASYSVYLVHIPVLAVVVGLVQAYDPSAPAAAVFTACVVAGVGAGMVFHRLVERPLTDLLRRLTRRSRIVVPAATRPDRSSRPLATAKAS